MAQRAHLCAKVGAGVGIFTLELEVRVGVLRVAINFPLRSLDCRSHSGQQTGPQHPDHSIEGFHAPRVSPMVLESQGIAIPVAFFDERRYAMRQA